MCNNDRKHDVLMPEELLHAYVIDLLCITIIGLGINFNFTE